MLNSPYIRRALLEVAQPYTVTKLQWSGKGAKKAIVFLAPGTEETELTFTVDVLRRCGVTVYIAGVKDSQAVKCSRKIKITPDIHIHDADHHGPYDVIVLPGGFGGVNVLSVSKSVKSLLKSQEKKGGIIAAIGAAPAALRTHSIYKGRTVTSYPSMEETVKEGGIYKYKTDKVVVDGPLITSRGPGTIFDFAFAIVEKLVGKEKASEVAKTMLIQY